MVFKINRAYAAQIYVLPQGEEYYAKMSGTQFQDIVNVDMNGNELFKKMVTVEIEKHATSPDIEPCQHRHSENYYQSGALRKNNSYLLYLAYYIERIQNFFRMYRKSTQKFEAKKLFIAMGIS